MGTSLSKIQTRLIPPERPYALIPFTRHFSPFAYLSSGSLCPRCGSSVSCHRVTGGDLCGNHALARGAAVTQARAVPALVLEAVCSMCECRPPNARMRELASTRKRIQRRKAKLYDMWAPCLTEIKKKLLSDSSHYSNQTKKNKTVSSFQPSTK